MKIVKTVKCKIKVNKKQFDVLKETLNRFANACNDILNVSQENRTTNKVRLQHLCYKTIKERYNLPANLVIRAIARVAVKRKGKKKAQFFKAKSFDLDQRIFSFKEKDMTVSIATHAGRLKGLKLSIGNYQLGLLKGQNPVSATLVYNKGKKCFYVHIVLEKPIETPFNPSGDAVGIDRGIYNLASCTNGLRFSGKQVIHKRKQYCKLRQSLQKKGTPSAKRRLKLLSGKERRWMSDQNHIISKRIIESCNSGDVLVLEDLKHIRDRVRLQRKQRLIHHSWAFGQLQSFLEYKATEKGIQLVYVDPKYSSQKCSCCGYTSRANRNGHFFSCKSCGYTIHADINSPFNIRQVYLDTLADGLLSYSPEAAPVMAVASPSL
jgi:IS605 OrfB family transposase